MVVATMLQLAVRPWLEAALDRAGGTLVFAAGGGVALALNLDCALPVAFGGSGVRTDLTAGRYLGGVMAGTEAALLLVRSSS